MATTSSQALGLVILVRKPHLFIVKRSCTTPKMVVCTRGRGRVWPKMGWERDPPTPDSLPVRPKPPHHAAHTPGTLCQRPGYTNDRKCMLHGQNRQHEYMPHRQLETKQKVRPNGRGTEHPIAPLAPLRGSTPTGSIPDAAEHVSGVAGRGFESFQRSGGSGV